MPNLTTDRLALIPWAVHLAAAPAPPPLVSPAPGQPRQCDLCGGIYSDRECDSGPRCPRFYGHSRGDVRWLGGYWVPKNLYEGWALIDDDGVPPAPHASRRRERRPRSAAHPARVARATAPYIPPRPPLMKAAPAVAPAARIQVLFKAPPSAAQMSDYDTRQRRWHAMLIGDGYQAITTDRSACSGPLRPLGPPLLMSSLPDEVVFGSGNLSPGPVAGYKPPPPAWRAPLPEAESSGGQVSLPSAWKPSPAAFAPPARRAPAAASLRILAAAGLQAVPAPSATTWLETAAAELEEPVTPSGVDIDVGAALCLDSSPAEDSAEEG